MTTLFDRLQADLISIVNTLNAKATTPSFEIIDRPTRNRRKLGESDLNWDTDLENALMDTINGGAIKLPLWQFHSSPAKGRLWYKGHKVKHRVLADLQTVAAWVE